MMDTTVPELRGSTTTVPYLHGFTCGGKSEDIEKMRKIVEKDPTSLTQLPRHHEPAFPSIPLMNAISAMHVDCVRFLLEAGSDSNTIDINYENNPLILVLNLQNTLEYTGKSLEAAESIVELLLDFGASRFVPHFEHCKCYYIECAVTSSGWKLTKMLIEHGCYIEDLKTDKENRQIAFGLKTPITNALLYKNIKALKLLLLHGASFNFYYGSPMTKFLLSHYVLEKYAKDIKNGDISVAIDVLKTYKLHGGNLWELKNGKNILQKLQQKEWYPNNSELEKEVEKLIKTPLSLQSQCRLIFKTSFGKKYCDRIEKLPLPSDIIDVLRFSDLD